MLCNYDTDYFLESILSAEGRRYNILSPLSPEKATENNSKNDDEKNKKAKNKIEPLIGRNISNDDVAGFFKTLTLIENHKSILQFVNWFQIADSEMIVYYTGMNINQFKKIRETCILTGLLFENRIKTEAKEYFWYMVDTGGVYALEDMGSKYNPLPFTLSLEQKYKYYLKAQFVFDMLDYFSMTDRYKIKDQNGQIYNIELLEDVKQSKITEYKNTVFLINREVLDFLNINKYAKSLAKQLNCNGNKFWDINEKHFLNILD